MKTTPDPIAPVYAETRILRTVRENPNRDGKVWRKYRAPKPPKLGRAGRTRNTLPDYAYRILAQGVLNKQANLVTLTMIGGKKP